MTASRLAWIPLLLLGSAAWAEPQAPGQLTGTDVNGGGVDLAQLRDQVVVINITSRYVEAEATHVNQALTPIIKPGRVVVVSVVDMMGIPDTMFEYVQKRVIDAAGKSPIIYLVDRVGRWRSALALDPTQHVGMLVLDRKGQVRGRFASDADLPAVFHLVAQLRPPPIKAPHR